MQTYNEDGQASLFGPDLWCGKMSQEHSAPTKGRTSGRSSKKLRESSSRTPLFLDLRKTNGGQAGVFWETDGASLGAYSTRSFGASPSEGVESRLSQILEDNPHQKYRLSAKACAGILNRASRRGKPLPPELEAALILQSRLE